MCAYIVHVPDVDYINRVVYLKYVIIKIICRIFETLKTIKIVKVVTLSGNFWRCLTRWHVLPE